ncbi:hypothetical protein ACJX0J_005710, partial [Zea mays]
LVPIGVMAHSQIGPDSIQIHALKIIHHAIHQPLFNHQEKGYQELMQGVQLARVLELMREYEGTIYGQSNSKKVYCAHLFSVTHSCNRKINYFQPTLCLEGSTCTLNIVLFIFENK